MVFDFPCDYDYGVGKFRPMRTPYDVTYISYMNGICAKHAYYEVEKTQTNSDIDSINN